MTILDYIAKAKYRLPEWRQAFGGASLAIMLIGGAAAADLAQQSPEPLQYSPSVAYDWTGFYAGAHTGYAWGSSNWTARSGGSVIDKGSLSLYQSYDGFNQGGSWFNGVQVGYNWTLQNRVVIGGEADFSPSSYPNYSGNTIGNTISVVKGTETYGDNIFAAGTVRGRVGYAPGNYLFYVTGGLAWTSEQFTLSGTNSTFQQRVGWAVGGGVEAPLIPHWTIKAEYLYTGYGNTNINFPSAGQHFISNLDEQEVRVGVNYQFGEFTGQSEKDPPGFAGFGFDPDTINIHGQATAVWQGYPAFPQRPGAGVVPTYLGFPSGGQGREIGDTTLYAGARLWSGAEAWINPEIDQGLGLNNNIGVSAFPNAEAFKLGTSSPYAKVQRAFIRQTIDLGGPSVELPADINQFAQTTTADRLVLTVGRFNPIDIFDTNSYAANPKTQFLNWGLFYALPFDYGGDAWGYGWGAVSELYKGNFTYRLGWFDTEKSAISDTFNEFGVDPTFKQYDIIGEIEERHELWGQPGKVKLNVNLIGGYLGTYKDAIAVYDSLSTLGSATPSAAQACELAPPNFGTPQTACVRKFTNKIDAHINIEQAITPDIGVFTRVGWAPGYVELLAITDSNFFASGGVSIAGTSWGRPKDTVGVGFVYQQISKAEQNYLNLGGVGSFVGDGQLANPQAEEVFETYYSYALSASTSVTLDYQLFGNPAFNGDRGPVNLFAGRIHWQF